MFNRINMIAIALAGVFSAAAVAPAMAYTPTPHTTINVGAPARVNVPTKGGVRPSHFETGSCQGCGVTVGGSVKAVQTPPPPPPSDGTGWQ